MDESAWNQNQGLDFSEVLRLELNVSTGQADFVEIDNIATVPEPGTALLLGLGLAGLAATGHSRRRATRETN